MHRHCAASHCEEASGTMPRAAAFARGRSNGSHPHHRRIRNRRHHAWNGSSDRLGVPHLDTDDFYWLPTNPPFTTKRPAAKRITLLLERLASRPGWVLSGRALNWGEPFEPLYDFIVFLTLDPNVRMDRIRRRELARYGDRIQPGRRHGRDQQCVPCLGRCLRHGGRGTAEPCGARNLARGTYNPGDPAGFIGADTDARRCAAVVTAGGWASIAVSELTGLT